VRESGLTRANQRSLPTSRRLGLGIMAMFGIVSLFAAACTSPAGSKAAGQAGAAGTPSASPAAQVTITPANGAHNAKPNKGISVVATVHLTDLGSTAEAMARFVARPEGRPVLDDSVLDAADEIELVDITPNDLRERVRDGAVLPPHEAAVDRRVVAADGVVDATDHGQPVRVPGDQRQRLGHLQARAVPRWHDAGDEADDERDREPLQRRRR